MPSKPRGTAILRLENAAGRFISEVITCLTWYRQHPRREILQQMNNQLSIKLLTYRAILFNSCSVWLPPLSSSTDRRLSADVGDGGFACSVLFFSEIIGTFVHFSIWYAFHFSYSRAKRTRSHNSIPSVLQYAFRPHIPLQQMHKNDNNIWTAQFIYIANLNIQPNCHPSLLLHDIVYSIPRWVVNSKYCCVSYASSGADLTPSHSSLHIMALATSLVALVCFI